MLSKRYESTEVDCRTQLIFALEHSLIHQHWHSSTSWNIKKDFYLDVYTILY